MFTERALLCLRLVDVCPATTAELPALFRFLLHSTAPQLGTMWNVSIPRRASQIFFFIILLQLPLFRVPCRSGTCTSPLEVTAVQLVYSKTVAHALVQAVLYPGACFKTLFRDLTLPQWSTLLQKYNLTDLPSNQVLELHRLEILIGSYFAVAGSVAGLLRPGRMSLFGILVLVWGLLRETFFNSSGKPVGIYMSPLMLFAVICAFLAVKYDQKKVQRLARPVSQPLKSSLKSKLR